MYLTRLYGLNEKIYKKFSLVTRKTYIYYLYYYVIGNNFFFVFLGLHPRHVEVPSLGGLIGATAAGLYHSHARSEPRLWPPPQLTATPAEQGQGSNHNLLVPNRISFHCATTGTSGNKYFYESPLHTWCMESNASKLLQVEVFITSVVAPGIFLANPTVFIINSCDLKPLNSSQEWSQPICICALLPFPRMWCGYKEKILLNM